MDWKKTYKKAVTFSYDDGVLQDERFVSILNKYHLKCTFNINSGFSRKDEPFYDQSTAVSHFDISELVTLYHGHEVSVHSYTHPDLTELSKEEIIFQIQKDIDNITMIFNQKPVGMAYPYGTYNDLSKAVIASLGLQYGRTVESNHNFNLQNDLLAFQPTCHHDDKDIFELMDRFLNSDVLEPQILYIWGHSYEFDVQDNWDHLERICAKISGHNNVFYGTNKEVLLGY